MEQVEQLRGGGDGRPRISFPFHQLLWFLFVSANLQRQHPSVVPYMRLCMVSTWKSLHVCVYSQLPKYTVITRGITAYFHSFKCFSLLS